MHVEHDITRNVPRSRASRIATYLTRMFPPQVMVTFAACHFLAVWFALQALGDLAPVQLTWAALRGIGTVALFLLLMRIYDELKDADTDIRLGRAGDPWYRDRPLVTGAVRIEDLKLLRWVVTASLVVINLRTGFAWSSVAFWVVLAVTWLSFKWFFWPPMSERLLVALATHNPISLLLDLYIVGLFADTFGAERVNASAFPLLVGLWLPIAAWETSRKIRAPEDETSYRTYSRELGWKVAPFLPASSVAGSAGLLLYVARIAGLGVVFPIVIAAVGAVVVFRCLLYRMAPTRQHANLKPWAILYTAVANAGLAAAAAHAGMAG
jgi:4-hydroxybenzoate polyprenyltransferase